MYMFMVLKSVCQFSEVIRKNLLSEVSGHIDRLLNIQFRCCSEGSLSFIADVSIVFLDPLPRPSSYVPSLVPCTFF
jgi:hypothetical protein